MNHKKNQLEIEKKDIEGKYILLKEDYDNLSKKFEEMKKKEEIDKKTN